MANVTKPLILDETGQAIVNKLGEIACAMTPPTAEDIATSAISGVDNVEDALDFVNDKIDEKTACVVKSINAIHPDAQGEVKITNVAYSDNFTSDKTQNSEGEFIIRTAGGDASISDGDAFVTRVYGNRMHTGYSPESLNMEVTMTPRVAPDPITAALNAETFEAYVSEAGIYTLTYTSSWSADPSLYGVTVTGTPLSGDSIEINWDGESEPYMTVTAPRIAPDGISATINRDTFVGYVSESGVTTLTYTTMWSANPALYGVTVTGAPVSGDYITITYYKEQRGTIAVATPSAFKSTWWNLYNHTAGYAYLTKYSTQYGFRIGGTYTALQYSETPTGTKSSITPVDGVFTIPGDGYVWVTGGNNTNTYIINQWSDWTDGPAGDFEAYSESTINLATIMNTYFPYGLLRVGVVRDEINVNASLAISKIDRMAYNAENLASAKASGRAYEYDANYIYIVKASYDSNSITLDGDYTASDHGNEFFVGTSVPVYLETMYGNNLKNKLERDVVTISQQTLTSAQQTQVRNNLSAASQADITTLNGSISECNNNLINLDGRLDGHNAGSHNSIYRGKYLGSSVSSSQWTAIKNGTFDDLFVGDYWTINGVNWRIAGFNYWYNTGDTNCTKNHAVIVPDSNLASCAMNSTNITTGAYVGSDFYTGNNSNTGKATAISAVNNAFGSGHILSHRELLANATVNGAPSGWAWYDSTVELMNEQMVYGSRAWGNQAGAGNGYDVGIDKSQLPLFQHDHSRIGNRANWWLRSVVSASDFAVVYANGHASYASASYSIGVRPAFGIFQS